MNTSKSVTTLFFTSITETIKLYISITNSIIISQVEMALKIERGLDLDTRFINQLLAMLVPTCKKCETAVSLIDGCAAAVCGNCGSGICMICYSIDSIDAHGCARNCAQFARFR